MICVHGKALGQKRPVFADFCVSLPATDTLPSTTRELIATIVRDQVRQFQDRQLQRQFLRALTEREIADGVERGKVEAGQSNVPLQVVDIESAIETATVAFQDGLYLIVLDGVQIATIDERIVIQPNSHVTFVRLTLLAGG